MNLGQLMTFKSILEDDSEPPEAIIEDGVLLDQSILTIIAPSKSKKTFLCMNFAKAIASGEGFAGFNINGSHRLLYLCAEGGYYPNRNRIKTIVRDMDPEILNTVFFPKYVNLAINDDADFKSICDLIEQCNPRVLIIDPFIRFHTVDENVSNCMSGIFKCFRHLIETYQLSIIIVHHSGKDPSKGGRGSSVISGEYDSAIYMKSNSDLTRLTFDMRHVETPDERYIRLNEETLCFELTESTEDPVVKYLLEHDSVSKTDLVKEWTSNSTYSQSYAYKLIDKAVDSNDVIVKSGILYLDKSDEHENSHSI